MQERIEVSTKADAEAAIMAGKPVHIVGGKFALALVGLVGLNIHVSADIEIAITDSRGSIVARGTSSPSIEARGTSSPSIVARGTSSPSIVAWGTSSPSIVAWDTSSPSIEAWDTSSPSIEARGTSSPSIEARGTSSPSIEARGTSSPSIEARGTSSPSIVAWDTSSPSIEAWDTSSPSIEAWDTSSPSIVAWDTSSPSIEAWDTSSPSIVARGTSSPSIVAWGTSSPRFDGAVKLRGDLRYIRADFFLILTLAHKEVPALICALRAGRVDGSTYSGACACLVGTLRNAGAINLPESPSSPAEKWFIPIREGVKPGDDCEGGFRSAKALEWALEYAHLTGLAIPTDPTSVVEA